MASTGTFLLRTLVCAGLFLSAVGLLIWWQAGLLPWSLSFLTQLDAGEPSRVLLESLAPQIALLAASALATLLVWTSSATRVCVSAAQPQGSGGRASAPISLRVPATGALADVRSNPLQLAGAAGGPGADGGPGASAELDTIRVDHDVASSNTPSVFEARESCPERQQMSVTLAEIDRLRSQLHECQEDLAAAQLSREQFLANMSHELRTPMNGIIGMAELLLSSDLPARQQRFAGSIASSADSLLAIINDLLDFSRIEAGNLSLESTRFSLRDCVEDVCALMAETAHAKGVELVCYVDDDVPVRVDGDSHRVRQIVHNLVSNAIAFTSEGEVVVRMSITREQGQSLRFRCDVQDTGAGITPELQMRLFEAFTQADATSTRRHGGLGMGLCIVQQLAALMNGTVRFRSRLGEGSRFTVTGELLDASSSEGQERSVEAGMNTPKPSPLRGSRVLIVDDNETNRAILEQQLTGWGMQVDMAVDAADALITLRGAANDATPFDALVLDFHMPDMDGIELARVINADPGLPPLRALLLTSASLPLDAGELRSIGIECFASKPVRQSLLHDSLLAVIHDRARPAPDADTPVDATAAGLPDGTGESPPGHLSVLLVEDNSVNQAVAVGMLELAGCEVSVAAEGQAAVDQCRERRFDLVFMDCQMPVMDGFEATRQIQREGLNTQTPIIALTANAMAGDREQCLATGMQDYLSKPVRQEQLQAKLAQWAVPASDTDLTLELDAELQSGESIADEVHDAALSLVNEKAIETIRSLQRPGKEDLLTRVLNVYFDTTPTVLADVQQALTEQDCEALRAAAHTLKSSSANVGADAVAASCMALEQLAGEDDLDAAAKVVVQLVEQADAVLPQLQVLVTDPLSAASHR